MVRYNENYVHLPDCLPSVKLLADMPPTSRLAGIVWGAPKWLSAIVEKRLGRVQEVKEIDSQGQETGKVLGYFFLKGVHGNPR